MVLNLRGVVVDGRRVICFELDKVKSPTSKCLGYLVDLKDQA